MISLNYFANKRLLTNYGLNFFIFTLVAVLSFYIKKVFIDILPELDGTAILVQALIVFAISLAFVFTTSLVKAKSPEKITAAQKPDSGIIINFSDTSVCKRNCQQFSL